jgi:hypothetical protein
MAHSHKFVVHFKGFCHPTEEADLKATIRAAIKSARPVFRAAGLGIRTRMTTFGHEDGAAVSVGYEGYDAPIESFAAMHRPAVPATDLVVFVVDLVEALKGVASTKASPNVLVDKLTLLDQGDDCQYVWAHEVAHVLTLWDDSAEDASLLFWDPCTCTKPPVIDDAMRDQMQKSPYVTMST